MPVPKNPDKYREIPLDQLIISEANVRRREVSVDIDELAHSMDGFGLQQPIVVQQRGEKFEIIIGQRRFLAAQALRWKSIPARVVDRELDDTEARAISFSENVVRRDLSPGDKAETCVLLVGRLGSVRKVAEYLGTTDQNIRRWLGYAGVAVELKDFVEAGRLTVPEVTRLSQYISDEDKAVEVARRMVEMRPLKAHRTRILESAAELGNAPVDYYFRRAEEKKREKKIIIVLPEKWVFALDRAAKTLNVSAGDLARDAVIGWLDSYRY